MLKGCVIYRRSEGLLLPIMVHPNYRLAIQSVEMPDEKIAVPYWKFTDNVIAAGYVFEYVGIKRKGKFRVDD